MKGDFVIAGTALPLVSTVIAAAGVEVPIRSVPYSPGTLDLVARLRGLKERDWPYWLEDWPATYALAEYLAGHPPRADRLPVLDLGCGTGFLAAFLRRRFDLQVLSCDFNWDACRLAALNIPERDEQPRVFCGDFTAFPSRLVFGLVLAGEMLYAPANHAPLLEFLKAHLAPGGEALFADPGRSAAVGFAAQAAVAGFVAEVIRVSSAAAQRNVQVYKLTRAGSRRA